mmetsp:Transcript_2880/g.6547  ORF Transcript_2880/g.6547 Transcript_2880/m.6547 type:complete len:229 (-) Transcript_2880:7-693(-)
MPREEMPPELGRQPSLPWRRFPAVTSLPGLAHARASPKGSNTWHPKRPLKHLHQLRPRPAKQRPSPPVRRGQSCRCRWQSSPTPRQLPAAPQRAHPSRQLGWRPRLSACHSWLEKPGFEPPPIEHKPRAGLPSQPPRTRPLMQPVGLWRASPPHYQLRQPSPHHHLFELAPPMPAEQTPEHQQMGVCHLQPLPALQGCQRVSYRFLPPIGPLPVSANRGIGAALLSMT